MLLIDRNHFLDTVRAIACIMIVFIHSPFPGEIGGGVKAIARFGVPFFFMLSGYYTFDISSNNYFSIIKNRLKKIVILFLISSFVYIAFNYSIHYFYKHTTEIYLLEFYNSANWINLLCFNYVTPFLGVGHLWYLLAIFYVYLISLLIEHYKLWKVFLYITPVLLSIVYLLECLNYTGTIVIPGYYYRNFLFEGIPFFIIGHELKGINNCKWLLCWNKYLSRCFLKNILVLFIITCAVFFLEIVFWGSDLEVYLHSVIICILCFLINIKVVIVRNILSYIGLHCSTYIYIFHYLFAKLTSYAFHFLSFQALWYKPFVVLGISIGFGLALDAIVRYFRKSTVATDKSHRSVP